MERSTSSSSSRRHHRDNNYNPSFSSTLLDAIYRSFDDSSSAASEKEITATRKGNYHSARNLEREEKSYSYISKIRDYEVKKKKQNNNNQKCSGYGGEEKLKTECEKQRRVLLLQNAAIREKTEYHSSSSSSESSSYGTGAGFSSSDDSFSRSQPLKPIRTSTATTAAPRQEKSDVKKKSRSLKNIYGDLKKVKQQPISPGGRLASFLNSLFTAGNAKKAKISAGGDEIRPSSTSACSSASSFSRSCLSKTPSSRGGGGGGGKRSVRFFPVSVIVDEDSRPCGHKSVYGERREDVMAISTTRVVSAGMKNPPPAAAAGSEELKYRVMSESRRVEEVARELLKSYNQRKSTTVVEEELFFRRHHRRGEDEVEVDVDDDVSSCASSDLFELDNLSSIEGIERYREELPVYETTHFKTNRAIANGLVY